MRAGADLSGRFDEARLAQHREEILEPQLPIVDPHHHMWSRAGSVSLFPELLADLSSGHNIRTTVFEECGSMYRADGPAELRSLGETEFITGVAAMSASGGFGTPRPWRPEGRKCESTARRARRADLRGACRGERRPLSCDSIFYRMGRR